MGNVEMLIGEDYLHLTGKEAEHLNEKQKKLVDFVQENLPKNLNLESLTSHNEFRTQKLETILIHLMGEKWKERITSFDWFCITSLSLFYSIGMPQEYQNDEAFEKNWKIFQDKGCQFLEKNYLEMGLKKIEANLLKLAGFKSVLPYEKQLKIIEDINPSDESIKSMIFLFLEALLKIAAVLILEVPGTKTRNNMIEDIRIDHTNQKITIEATYQELNEKNQLDRLCNLIELKLKDVRDVLEKKSIFLNRVNLNAKIKDPVPQMKEEIFFGRERDVRKIFLLSEAEKVAIVTGQTGVGISTTFKYGVEPALKNLGAYVVYCPVNKGFQQSILETLDLLFPTTRADNLFAQLEMISSENRLLILVLDQFEKIFTIDNSNKLNIEMSNFLKQFKKLGSRTIRLILGIREDYLGQLHHFSQEIGGFYSEEAFYYLKNFDRENAWIVIKKLIEQMHLPVDRQLINTMLDDLTQREATIYPPVIHIILSQLIKRHKERYLYNTEKDPLNLNFYIANGGAKRILLDYAREKIEELSKRNEIQQKVCIEIIQKMVTPFFTTQRIHHREIVELNGNRCDIDKLIEWSIEVKLLRRIEYSDGYTYELLHDFLRKLVPTNPNFTGVEDTLPLIREAIAFIDANYSRQISLQEVARKVGVTPEYLSRQFKSEFKIGFKEYITQRRIEEAKQLLLRFPELPINELSQKAGFASPQNFISVFKNQTQYTPHRYRQKSLLYPDLAEKPKMRSH